MTTVISNMGCCPAGNKKREGGQAKVPEVQLHPGPKPSSKVVSSEPTPRNAKVDAKPNSFKDSKEKYSEKVLFIEGDDLIKLGGPFTLRVKASTKSGKLEVGQTKIEVDENFNMVQANFKLDMLLKEEENNVKFKFHFVFDDGNTYKFISKLQPGIRSIQNEFGVRFEVLY